MVSWLVLRGKCRDCGEPISWRYPLGEALTAALFAAVAVMDGLSWLLLPHLLFVSALILVSQVDLEIKIIPDIVILPVAALGLPLMIVLGSAPWWQWPLAGLGAAGFLFLISEVYFRIRHVEGMGFGDVKLALCMGVYLGPAVVPALFIGLSQRCGGRRDPDRRPPWGREDRDSFRAVPGRGGGPGVVLRRRPYRRLSGARVPEPLTTARAVVNRPPRQCHRGAAIITLPFALPSR